MRSFIARVQPWGIADLQVVLDVEAPDMVTALSRAKELVADRLGADLQIARVSVREYGARQVAGGSGGGVTADHLTSTRGATNRPWPT